MKPRFVPALLLALALSACGSTATATGAGTGTGSPSASPSVDRQQAALKFAQCMRENGVQMEDPGANGMIKIQGGPGDREKVEKAQKACQQHMQGSVGDRAGGLSKEEHDRLLKFAQCMRDNGVPMDDPGMDGRIEFKISKDIGEKKVEAAQAACKEYAPGGKG
ncbi:hypothetical protein [Nonomuraea sp. NPDC050310]|uniref:hypothetical protein n=1 Tax=unclassified Nonomuraea TaxID=2593643 RepID=UPI0034020FBB